MALQSPQLAHEAMIDKTCSVRIDMSSQTAYFQAANGYYDITGFNIKPYCSHLFHSELISWFSCERANGNIAILTFYHAQVKAVRQLLDPEIVKRVEVCTHSVDSYQGREADVVILSCVRGGGSYVVVG